MAGKMKIHRNDSVEIIAGKERGKRGEVVNVMIICKKCGKTRIAYEIKDGKKIRVCRKCGEAL